MTTRQTTLVYQGPGPSFAAIGLLRPDASVAVLARNRVGTWLQITDTNVTGWVLSGHLLFEESVNFEQYPVDQQIADGVPGSQNDAYQSLLNHFPVIPNISPRMRQVYELGQSLHNNPTVVTKVGDSVIANEWYLLPMSQPKIDLGPYEYLRSTLNIYGLEIKESLAARQGLTSIAAVDPIWANERLCLPNEGPLSCEYRLRRPVVAFIMFGHNDIKAMPVAVYRSSMERVIQITLLQGIIPVLVTFSSHPETPVWTDSLRYNVELVSLATQYEVPLLNLWLATRSLPNYGLDIDNIHLKNSGYNYLALDAGQESRSGVALLNLLSLRTLHEINMAVFGAGNTAQFVAS